MSISFQINCSHCGKILLNEDGEMDFDASELSQLSKEMIADRVRELGWVAQENGEHLDTYCSKRCAQ